MQVRSPLLQTGFTKGHRHTGLFSFMLLQCEPDSVKARSLLDCLEQTDAGQFSPHRSGLPRLPCMDMAAYSPFVPEPENETESSPCKIALGLSASCSDWILFPGHSGKVCFKAKLKSGTRYFSLPTTYTVDILYLEMCILIKKYTCIYT